MAKLILMSVEYTGHTQNNGAVSIAFTIETAPFFCVYPVLLPPYAFMTFMGTT
jgi:hypothetical protein